MFIERRGLLGPYFINVLVRCKIILYDGGDIMNIADQKNAGKCSMK